MDSHETYYDPEALYDRLTDGVLREARPIVFLFGSAITAPLSANGLGVPGTSQIVDLIRAEFSTHDALNGLEQALRGAANQYQEAFHYLLGRRSQELANEIIKRSVWRARKPVSQQTYIPSVTTDDQACQTLDSDIDGWYLSPAVEAVGKLAAYYPDHFGKQILTTNFDPLLEVAIQRQGGRQFRTVLQRDGYLSQTTAEGCHVVHLHGYWHGADTLHTVRQLAQDRPRLKHSLSQILKDKTLLVCGYGGWEQGLFNKFVWVDCKEESERFENRLISILVRESKGTVSGNDLSHLNIVAISEQLVRVISSTKYLFVFDNIDHYVDLENNVLVANADAFLRVFLAAGLLSRVIFTCRPSVQYSGPDTLSLRLEGLSVSATGPRTDIKKPLNGVSEERNLKRKPMWIRNSIRNTI